MSHRQFFVSGLWLFCAAVVAASPASADVTVNLTRGSTNTNTTGAAAKLASSCGILKTYATAPKTGRGAATARIKEGWHPDTYKNTSDPAKAGKKYGDHLTVDMFNGGSYQFTCHYYESGALWCDNGHGGSPSHKCDAP